MKIAIIGGGAAGFFSAISAKENYPNSSVTIFEKSQKLLSKVKISGGGRCNVTHNCPSIALLCNAYPRGGKKLKKAFHIFNTSDTIDWFETKGVPLYTQDDNCVFPVSQKSQSIIDCFIKETERLKIEVILGMGIKSIKPIQDQLELHFLPEGYTPILFDKIIIATGGSPKRKGLEWLEKLNHNIEAPVPSLFTFNMPSEPIIKLMGVVADNAMVSIQGTKLKSSGPLLITHWGMSGPAILKLSAFGARVLSEMKYNFVVQVNWVNEKNCDVVLEQLKEYARDNPNKALCKIKPYSIPERLWLFLLDRIGIHKDKKWNELGKKLLNKLMMSLTNDEYKVEGKATFKHEFVTCGGVSLQSIDLKTMQSKIVENLYFAGEVMDIDAITGGYNFQAAWTTGFIAGRLM